MVKKLFVFFVSLLFVVSVCYGQTGLTGTINGTVVDPDGTALPGITVTLESSALVLGKMTTVTNAAGMYRFLALSPGAYQLTFVLEGMNTLVRKGIVVRASKTASVDVQMQLKSVQEQIVVSGQAPTVDRQSTSGVASMDIEFLKLIPARRDIGDYFNMAPGVTGDTAHGSSTMDNSYNLDGVNVGDPATGMDFVSYGMDIMEEISIQSGGLSAEYGSVKGAVINVITKSGGNQFSGTASFYYDHESLQSENTKGTVLYDPDGNSEKTGRKFSMEPVLTLGGPLVKDKLWFFTNLSMATQETYAPGYPHDGTEDLPADQKQYFPYLKFTYQPNQKNKFILSWNYSDRIRNHRGADRFESVESTVKQNTPTHVFNLHWTKTFGDNFFGNIKFGMVKFNMNLDAKQPGTFFENYTTSFGTGSAWRNKDDNWRDRYQVNLDGTTFVDDFMGSHEIKFGAEMQMAKVRWLIETATDTAGVPAYAIMAPEFFGEPGYWYGYYINGFDRQDDMLDFAVFFNDVWNITNNLTMQIGLRYEYNSIVWPKQNVDAVSFEKFGVTIDRAIPESVTATKWSNLVPRLGLIYDLFSDGSTLFKASYSRYVQPNQIGWTNSAHTNGWFATSGYLDHNSGEYLPGLEFPMWFPSTMSVGYNNQDLIAPIGTEVTVGIERELWEDWSVSARYIKKWEKDLIHIVDAAELEIDTLLDTGELVWKDYEEVQLYDPFSGENVTFYNNLNPGRVPEEYIINPPDADRQYDGFEFTLKKRYSHGWSVQMSYVYGNSRGLISTTRGGESLGTSGYFANPNYHINADGRFPRERRHQLKVNAVVKGPWGINLGTYIRYLGGRRYTRTVSSDYLGYTGILNQDNVVVFAEQRGSQGYPNRLIVDLKFEKAFRFGKFQLKMFADIFNLFNDNTITAFKTVNSSHPFYNYLEESDLVDPRVIRLGAKIEFN
ncbi:MAG: TonB-dependent receptor [bacterium]|nr:TonB-dependent receptor [bacterium]